VPPASMAIFDASNRDICEMRRLRTNTPLQALVMMNDPAVLEASRVLAARLLQQPVGMDQKITEAFRLIVGRKPRPKELELLQGYYRAALASLTPDAASRALAVGEYPLPEKINMTELAAMMRVVSTIYNMEEAITKP